MNNGFSLGCSSQNITRLKKASNVMHGHTDSCYDALHLLELGSNISSSGFDE